MKKKCILLAGCGTGGHTIPGICLANELKKMYPDYEIIFFVPGKPIDKEILSATSFSYFINSMTSFPRSVFGMFKFPFRCMKSLHETRKLFKQYSIKIVIALGGYASLSAGYFAAWKKIPVVSLESNKIAGKTIKMLAKISQAVYTPWEVDGLNKNIIRPLGIPIRTDLPQKHAKEYLDKTRLTILVMGGSLGSGCINTVVCKSLELLKQYATQLEFIHLCGKNAETIQKIYDTVGIKGTVIAFEPNMPSLYEKADLVIARAGGASLAEIRAMGMPSIIIPWKYAADQHQLHNALAMSEKNASICYPEDLIDETILSQTLQEFLKNPQKLYDLCKNASEISQRDAGYKIACDIKDMIKE